MADVNVENHGTIFLLRPLNGNARCWCEEHLPEDAPMFGNAYAVEHRYIADIVAGIQNDGLEVA